MIRASSIQRYRKCPGAPRAEKSLPAEVAKRTAVWTGDGVLVHEALKDDSKIAGLSDALLEVVDSMSMSAGYVLDKILPNEEGIERLECVREREEPFFVYHDGSPIISGHPDLIQYGTIYGRRVAVILDFKSGYLDVPSPECNDQLRAYAVGVWQESGANGEPVSEVYASIIPRFGRPTTAVYAGDDLQQGLLDLVEIHQATLDHAATRTPSVEACRYCPARATSACPETLHPPKGLINMPSLIDLTPARKGELLVICEIVSGNIKALKERLTDELRENPDSVDGWHLVPGDVRSTIPDAGKAFNVVSELLSSEEFQGCLKVGLTDLKNELKGKLRETEGLKGRPAAARVDAILAPVLVKKQGEARLERKDGVAVPTEATAA